MRTTERKERMDDVDAMRSLGHRMNKTPPDKKKSDKIGDETQNK